MKVSADIHNCREDSQVILSTNGNAHFFKIESSSLGFGSGTTGPELLCLAIATSYCDRIHKEAIKRSIKVDDVEIEVDSEFGEDGGPAGTITYRVKVKAYADEKAIHELMVITDMSAVVPNTIRKCVPVMMEHAEAVNMIHLSDKASV